MRRPLLLLAAALVVATAGAASAEGELSTDTLLTTPTTGGLTISGGAVPTASVSVAIGSTAGVTGSLMTVTDLRGQALGWDVTAKYVAPPSTAVLDGASTQVTGLGAGAVKVRTAGVTTTTLNGSLTYPQSFVALDPTTAVNVASASSNTSGGTTTFSTAYQVTLPGNAEVGKVYGASVSYTVAPKVS